MAWIVTLVRYINIRVNLLDESVLCRFAMTLSLVTVSVAHVLSSHVSSAWRMFFSPCSVLWFSLWLGFEFSIRNPHLEWPQTWLLPVLASTGSGSICHLYQPVHIPHTDGCASCSVLSPALSFTWTDGYFGLTQPSPAHHILLYTTGCQNLVGVTPYKLP